MKSSQTTGNASHRAFRFRRLTLDAIRDRRRSGPDQGCDERVRAIIRAVREGGDAALRALARQYDGLEPGRPLVHGRIELEAARDRLAPEIRAVLERTVHRIRAFAAAQRAALLDVSAPVPGGRGGHNVVPLAVAGCYAPGGRYPLPSSLLMTAVTARAAGVGEVWAATPAPAPLMLAAAAVAGADFLLAAGGAQAVAALAFGTETVRACSIIAGPGNRWVTRAKSLVADAVAIDTPAGPSELLVVADRTAAPGLIAADLAAQAEHDPESVPILVALDKQLMVAVEGEIDQVLRRFSTAAVARRALANGFALLAASRAQALAMVEELAPEHLEIHLRRPGVFAREVKSAGAVFIGPGSAVVFGDYGAGPNHTLPTGGQARCRSGLSVMNFLRIQTWLEIDDPAAGEDFVGDVIRLARLEGLETHALAAALRQPRR